MKNISSALEKGTKENAEAVMAVRFRGGKYEACFVLRNLYG
jgi:hypothetical protein